MESNETFGPWRLLQKLAEGGMAVTWLARAKDAEVGNEVVLKRIHPSLISDDELRDLFVEEARMAKMLEHPNLVRTFAAGEADGEHFLTMEYVWGEDLRRIAERGVSVGKPLPLRVAVRLIADAARGLHDFHELKDETGEGISPVHRDISPPNLMLTYDGRTKVIDFGIAKVESRYHNVRQGQLKGKFSYMSPEQVQGLEIDRRSDIFALGIVLYEITTMRRLFKADSDVLTIKLVSEARVMAPHVARHDYPPRLGEIVLKALSRDPRQRHTTAGEFADELEAFLAETRIEPTQGQIAQYMTEIFPDRLEALQQLLGDGYSGPLNAPVLPDIKAPEPTRRQDGATGSDAAASAPEDDSTGRPRLDTDDHEDIHSGKRFAPEPEASTDDGDEDILRQQRQSRRILTVFAMLALIVVAWIVYTLMTHGAGTRLADFEPSEPRAMEEGAEAPDPPPTVMHPVTSTPAGARVVLNGALVEGTTPLDVPFVEGQVNDIGVLLDGHVGQRMTMVADEAFSGLEVELAPLSAPEGWEPPEVDEEAEAPEWPTTRLRIVTTHGGQRLPEASVLINGVPLEGATPVETTIPAGVPVHITTRMQDFRNSTTWHVGRESRRARSHDEVLMEMTRADQAQIFTSLRLNVNPPGATIHLGDEVVQGRTQQLRAPGHYPVRIEAEGYLPWESAFSTGPGIISERVVLDEVPREPSRVTLRVDPEGTQLYAARDGDPAGARRLGNHTVTDRDMDSGAYEFTFVYRSEEAVMRGRVTLTLEGNTHHQYHYTLGEEGAELVREESRPLR